MFALERNAEILNSLLLETVQCQEWNESLNYGFNKIWDNQLLFFHLTKEAEQRKQT